MLKIYLFIYFFGNFCALRLVFSTRKTRLYVGDCVFVPSAPLVLGKRYIHTLLFRDSTRKTPGRCPLSMTSTFASHFATFLCTFICLPKLFVLFTVCIRATTFATACGFKALIFLWSGDSLFCLTPFRLPCATPWRCCRCPFALLPSIEWWWR